MIHIQLKGFINGKIIPLNKYKTVARGVIISNPQVGTSKTYVIINLTTLHINKIPAAYGSFIHKT